MGKIQEVLIILITSILLVFTLYIFKGYIPSVNGNKDRPTSTTMQSFEELNDEVKVV